MIGPQTPDPLPRSLHSTTDRIPAIEDLLATGYVNAPTALDLAWCVAEIRALRIALARAEQERDYYIGRLHKPDQTQTSLGPDFFARRLREGEAAAAEYMASHTEPTYLLELDPRAGQEGEADTQP